MNLFSRKAKVVEEPIEPPSISVGPLEPRAPAAAPPPPPPSKPALKHADSVLKLDLPNVFAYDQDETKAKLGSQNSKTNDDQPAAKRGTVLLVESDEEVCRLISRLLEHEGLHVAKASCLAEAKTVLNDLGADYLLARRHCVPLNLQTEHVLRDLQSKTSVRIVDDFSELLLGQVIDYESMAQCTLSLTDLLMSLLEGANVGARGHAHSVAKYCRLVGQRMGLSRRELDALTLAAMLHDLGSIETKREIGGPLFSGSELLPPTVRATLEMLANTPFPFQITELINSAADVAAARKSPEAGKTSQVSKSASILRAADGYDSLRRASGAAQQTDEEIFEQMRRQPTGVFDLDVLETFIHMRKHEQAVSAMNIFWAAVLIVDSNPAEQQLLKMRLENDDFHVVTAKTVDEALHLMHTENITLVISENKLERGDGFELLRTMRGDPALRQIPFVFHALAETDLVRYALELGAEDWLAKPHNVEIMAMKLQRIISRRHTSTNAANGDGVRGNLREMGIIELVQILNSGGRSVQILMENGKRNGEMTLQHGQIISATCGETTGEKAALELLSFEDGLFRILPLRQAPPVTIRTSADNLLLQCCYQKDKKNSPESRGLPA